MLVQFVLTNLHFILTLFLTFVLFTVGWLHLDSWTLEKGKRSVLLRSVGFFLLAIGWLAHSPELDVGSFLLIGHLAKVLGLFLIFVSLFVEPLLSPPKRNYAIFPYIFVLPFSVALNFFVGLMYWVKGVRGYELQIKTISFAFLLFFLAEIANLSPFWTNPFVVFWSNLFGQFGPAWTVSHVLEFFAAFVLGVWAWGYLRFRPQPQVFISLVLCVFLIFASLTFLFNFFLLKNIEKDFLDHLKTDVLLFNYATESLKNEARASANTIAESASLKSALLSANREELSSIASNFVQNQKLDIVTIILPTGEVAARVDGQEEVGDSLLNDSQVSKALAGETVNTFALHNGATSPIMEIHSLSPVKEKETGKVLGVVLAGFVIDSAFVDGIKEVTGLDSTVFAGDVRAATTFVSSDGKSRFVGTKDTNKQANETVLQRGEIFTGKVSVFSQPYYAAYSPVRSSEGNIIGMIFVGAPQTGLLEIAQGSIQLTMLGSILLLVLSLIPAYFVSSFISRNLKA